MLTLFIVGVAALLAIKENEEALFRDNYIDSMGFHSAV
jgi:hypothetical protein